jgi:hypothetical protein
MSSNRKAITLNIAFFTTKKSQFWLFRKAENVSRDDEHRFIDSAQFVFQFYKRQNMISTSKANPYINAFATTSNL